MTPSAPVQDLATQWASARKLYPIYFELAREFAIDVKAHPDLEAGTETPGKEVVEQARQWLEQMDSLIQVHQLRQFLQTSSAVNQDSVVTLIQHFLAQQTKTDIIRDKVDFLLVQYFSQLAPTGIDDSEVDLAYVAQSLDTVVAEVELKPPVWLNALDRVLDSARKCKSLDELLHGGILEQGRKAKGLAGDLFYLPVALVAFTRFGYLMRRVFFRLMLGDLNAIVDGLSELEEKGIQTIDCRRAQFSAQEPIMRLRMICQSWKVMFQAEYSSGSPLRMLVDLRASVEQALGRGKAVPDAKGAATSKVAPKAAPKASMANAAAASSGPTAGSNSGTTAAKFPAKAQAPAAKPAAQRAAPVEAPEFEVAGASDWDPDSASATKK
ncbi:MAG: hypothetical protein ACRD3B_11585 [Candidatus Sulfotelmatobacter sp.]